MEEIKQKPKQASKPAKAKKPLLDRKKKRVLIAASFDVSILVLKYFLYLFTGITIIYADFLHSVSDVFITLSILIGILFIIRLKGKRKELALLIELFLSIVIVLLIVYSGINVILVTYAQKGGYGKNIFFAIAGEFIIALAIYLAARYKHKVGTEENIKPLVLDGMHTRLDMYSSLAILIDLTASLAGLQLKKITVLIIALFIFKSAIDAIVHVVGNLKEEKESLTYFHKYFEKLSILYNKVLAFLLKLFSIIKISIYLEKSKRNVVRFVFAFTTFMIFAYLLSGIYIINEDETGIVFRFSEYLPYRDANAGMHYHLPYPFEKVIVVKTSEIHSITAGKQYKTDFTITGDENLVDLSVTINYRIIEPHKYYTRSVNITNLIRIITEASARMLAGKYNIDGIITTDKIKFRKEIEDDIRVRLKKYNMGITIYNIQLKKSSPPQPIILYFNNVASAREQRQTKINEAKQYKNSVIPDARGKAETLRLAAEAYATKVVNDGEGETSRFASLYKEYVKNPKAQKQSYYLDRIIGILGKGKLTVSDSDKWQLRIMDKPVSSGK